MLIIVDTCQMIKAGYFMPFEKEFYFDFESNSSLVCPAIPILTEVRPVRVFCWNPTMGQHPLRKIKIRIIKFIKKNAIRNITW